MLKSKARRCEVCGWVFPTDAPPAECFRCEAERNWTVRWEERRRLEEESRDRLGDAPLTRSILFIRYGIMGAEEGIESALRHARGNRAAAVRSCAEHLARARAALEEGDHGTFTPRWPAP
jgi:hypothetical protein